MATRVGVIQFPGTNCELDVVEATTALGAEADVIFHDEKTLGDIDVAVIAGGFAHGDYLRPGAIARFSPVMQAVADFARDGGKVVGICNGFQILTEAQMLPGTLHKNESLKFRCEVSDVIVASNRSILTKNAAVGDRLLLPISNSEGNYTCSDETLRELIDEDRIVLTYSDNHNGSMADIAGISNADGNVVGLMPHPERAYLDILGTSDGRVLLESMLS